MLAQISEMRDVVSDLDSLVVGDADVDQVLLKKGVLENIREIRARHSLNCASVTYHESFKHLVVTFVSPVLKGSDEDFESLVPASLVNKLVGLLEGRLGRDVLICVLLTSILLHSLIVLLYDTFE